MKKYFYIPAFLFLFLYITGCGTLGSFSIMHFSVNKKVLSLSIDSLYLNYPSYKIPEKWKKFDDWKDRGYGFLDSRIFYFRNNPEEMFYVTITGDTSAQSHSQMSIRAVCRGNAKWLLQENFSKSEIEKIELKFESEILSKIPYSYYKSD